MLETLSIHLYSAKNILNEIVYLHEILSSLEINISRELRWRQEHNKLFDKDLNINQFICNVEIIGDFSDIIEEKSLLNYLTACRYKNIRIILKLKSPLSAEYMLKMIKNKLNIDMNIEVIKC